MSIKVPSHLLLEIFLFMDPSSIFMYRILSKEIFELIFKNILSWSFLRIHEEPITMKSLINKKFSLSDEIIKESDSLINEYSESQIIKPLEMDVISKYQGYVDVILNHFFNQRMKGLYPNKKLKKKFSGFSAIVNLHYHKYDINEKLQDQKIQWTKDEYRAVSSLSDGFWIASGMSLSGRYSEPTSKIAIYNHDNTSKVKTLNPKWSKKTNSIIFDSDLSDIPQFGENIENGTLQIGRGSQIEAKAKKLSSSMLPIKLVTCGYDSNLVVYNFVTGNPINILQGQKQSIYSCKAINKNQVVSVGIDRSLYLWDLHSMKLVQKIEKIHNSSIYGVVVEKDNCAMTHSKDGHIKIFDFRCSRLKEDAVFDLVAPPKIPKIYYNNGFAIGRIGQNGIVERFSIPQTHNFNDLRNEELFKALNPPLKPIYNADMCDTQIAATSGADRLFTWDLRNSSDPVLLWDSQNEIQESKITAVACERGRVIVSWSSVQDRDGVKVFETLTSKYESIYEYRFASEGKIGDQIILKKKPTNPINWGFFVSFDNVNILELGF